MRNPICFALDFPTLNEATIFVNDNRLYDHIGAVKVGLELFIAGGPRAVKVFDHLGFDVVLDLKLHDIPETVERAVKAGGDLGARFMTLHIQQRATLERAVRAAEPFGITLLGVTVLTSMTDVDMRELTLNLHGDRPGARAALLAEFGSSCGLRGFVCSPQEVAELRTYTTKNSFFLVPGIRPVGADAGDQKRVGTPSQAISDGASLLVVGRPIRDAEHPNLAAKAILAEALGVAQVDA